MGFVPTWINCYFLHIHRQILSFQDVFKTIKSINVQKGNFISKVVKHMKIQRDKINPNSSCKANNHLVEPQNNKQELLDGAVTANTVCFESLTR